MTPPAPVPNVAPAVPRPPGPTAGGPPIPASGAIEQLTPQQAAQVAQLAAQLSALDYFQVLKLAATATPDEIKKAFYRESRIFHPDRFFHLADDAGKTSLSTIYKRVTEAYYFLKDDQKRRKYAADVAGPDRKNRLRFTEASEVETKAEVKKQAEEEIGTHPKGRSFYAAAQKEMAADNWNGAQRSLKTALTYEPSNARYKAELLKVEEKLHAIFKAKGHQFTIK